MVQTVQKPMEIPQVHFLDKIVGIPRCCATTGAQKPVEIAQLLFLDRFVDMPVVVQ